MIDPRSDFINVDLFLKDCLQELDIANDNPLLDEFEDGSKQPSVDARTAALELSRVLGTCRVLGIPVPQEIDGEFPPNMAIAAAKALKETVDRLIAATRELSVIAETAVDSHEVLDACADLVDGRFSCYFATEILNDAWISALNNDDPLAKEIDVHNDTVEEFLTQFDLALIEHVEEFAPLADTWYFHNWRVRWEACSEAPPPPWIAGMLEPVEDVEDTPLVLRKHLQTNQLWKQHRYALQMATTPTLEFRLFQWRSPDQQSQAKLVVPKALNDDNRETPLVLEVDSPTPGKFEVSLAGLPSRSTDEHRQIRILPAELASTNSTMTLVVDGVEWELARVVGE